MSGVGIEEPILVSGSMTRLAASSYLVSAAAKSACAWATFACYGSMMVISFLWGQKEYPIPYAWKKLTAYVVICVALFGLHQLTLYFTENNYIKHSVGILLFGAFAFFILKVEKKEFQKIPYLYKII